MSMVVQHNLTAMNSNRMLGITTSAQAKSTEKLSSGYKINRAADDAAGLTISEKMRKQMRGLDRSSTNAEDGVSAVQTAEGALTEVHSMLQRMNELAVQSANGTNSDSDRDAIQAEIDQLVTEIDRVSETTKFNEIYLLKGNDEGEKTTVYSYKMIQSDAEATIVNGATIYVEGQTTATTDPQDIIDAKAAGKELYSSLGTEATNGDYTAGNTTTSLIAGKTVYDATGTAITTDAALATAVSGGGVYTDTGIAATNGDATYDASSSAFNATVDLYNADGTLAYAQGASLGSSNTAANYYTTAPTKAVNGTDYKSETDYTLNSGTDLFDKNGTKLTDATLTAALNQGEKVYTSAPTKATSDDYTYTEPVNKQAVLYDENGRQVAADKIDDILEEGGKLYSDREATSEVTDLSEYTDSREVNAALEFNLHVGADSAVTNKISVKIDSMSAAGIGVEGLKVDTEDSATAAIDTIAAAIQQVSSQRSALGAIQNRLEHTIANLDNIVENTTAAESRIRDTDMAEEMVEYSKNNILAQAGQSMLAQANQSTQGVLSLLG